jgi:hypothetical protein
MLKLCFHLVILLPLLLRFWTSGKSPLSFSAQRNNQILQSMTYMNVELLVRPCSRLAYDLYLRDASNGESPPRSSSKQTPLKAPSEL